MNLGLSSVETSRLWWFARAWAIAVLFHLVAQPREAAVTQPFLAVLSLLVAAAAVLTFLRPQDRRALLALGLLVPLHAWCEAPVVGNHWVLAALMSLSVGLGLLGRLGWGITFSAVRATLLVAYSFAAFAKLNTDFLNPVVSCVVYFQDQLVKSWGLDSLSLVGSPALAQAVAALTILIELSVAVLLTVPRTRRIGLILAFGFHWMLALDLHQHFWDFSSVLFAGFLLFLDDNQVKWLQEQLKPLARYRPGSQLLAVLAGLVGAVVGIVNILPLKLGYSELLQQLAHAGWLVYGTSLVLLVTAAYTAPRVPKTAANVLPMPAWMLLPAALAAFNGLTPYLELKTGFGWNMYSNLRTVAGHTNHLLIPRTLDLTHSQQDLVQIVKSSDPNLQRLHDEGFALTYPEFRSYAHRFPASPVTYRWKGQTRQVARLADDPAGQGPLNVVALKLWAFRPVDLQPAQRCYPNFTPAR